MTGFSDLRLETARLNLRPFRHADAADLFAVFSDPDVFRYTPIGDWKHLDEAHQRIARDIEKTASGEYIRLAVERREDSRVLGEVLLFNIVKENRAEMGYALARAAWGQGYASEALPALLDHAFGPLGLNRIEAIVDPRNTASVRVVQGLGFTHEGTQRERYVMRGETSDGALYGL